MNEKFFIYKTAYSKDDKPDLSFVPMLMRRKLSLLAKLTFYVLNSCYDGRDINIVFASRNGEYDRLEKLIKQYTEENEVSPVAFSSSVHNAAVGTFSLFHKITSKYNAVSAGENTISNGFWEAFSEDKPTLFCYADTLPEPVAVACLIGKIPADGADKIEFIKESNSKVSDNYDDFVNFLSGKSDEYRAGFYTLRRLV